MTTQVDSTAIAAPAQAPTAAQRALAHAEALYAEASARDQAAQARYDALMAAERGAGLNLRAALDRSEALDRAWNAMTEADHELYLTHRALMAARNAVEREARVAR